MRVSVFRVEDADDAGSEKKPFRDPADVRHFSGAGATEEDAERGYLRSGVRDRPEYDFANYRNRATIPSHPDEDFGDTGTMPDDWAFRRRGMRARGFLTRPSNSTER